MICAAHASPRPAPQVPRRGMLHLVKASGGGRAYVDRVSPKLARSLQSTFVILASTVDWTARGAQSLDVPASWMRSAVDVLSAWARAMYISTTVRALHTGGRYIADVMRGRKEALVDPAIVADGWVWEGGVDGLVTWLDLRTAELVRQMSERQRQAIAAEIRHWVVDDPRSPDFVARQLRQHVGLLTQQVDVLARMRRAMEEDGASEAAIERRLQWYSRIQLRRRTELIARTELATAWYQGEMESFRQMVATGRLDAAPRKQWWTADDEVTCDLCGPLHMTEVEFDEEFPGGVDAPPLHPGCRCDIRFVTT